MKKNATKRALVMSLVSLMLCFSMLLGTTYAWFTDSVTSTNNIIKSGNLDVKLQYSTDLVSWNDVDATTNVFGQDDLWEPGYTKVVYLRVSNVGSLAMKYKLGVQIASEIPGVNQEGNTFYLSEYIRYGVVENVTASYGADERAEARGDVTSPAKLNEDYLKEYTLQGKTAAATDADTFALVVYMPEEIGNVANHNGSDIPVIHLGLQVFATQLTAEKDSFNDQYDKDATYVYVSGLGDASFGAQTLKTPVAEATLPAALVQNLNAAGKPNFVLAHDEPEIDGNKITFTRAEILDENGNVIDLEAMNNTAPITVVLDVPSIANGETVNIFHDGVQVASAVVTDGKVSYTVTHFCEIVVKGMAVAGDAASLKDAVANAADGDTILLSEDVTLSETLTFDGADVILDLGGKTIEVKDVKTALKISSGNVTLKNGTIKNVAEAATETKYSVYMAGDAQAVIENVTIETSGTGIYMTENAKITKLDANVDSYMNANGYCCYDAVTLVGNARIDKISGGTYVSKYSDEYLDAWNIDHKYSGIVSYPINLNDSGASIGEISGGTFLGVMDKANNGTPIHVNNGTVEEISGGYFGFVKLGLTAPDTLLYVNTTNGGKIEKISGGTFEKGDWKGFGCDFAGIVEASGCQVVETGETVEAKVQFSTRVATYNLEVVKVEAK